MQKSHNIKLATGFFNDIVAGLKTFEIRFNDRDYQVGDILFMTEISEDPDVCKTVTAEVIYSLPGGQYGIEPGYIALGINYISSRTITKTPPTLCV